MQEVFENIIEKLKEISIFMTTCDGYGANCVSVGTIEEIVKHEAEKYNNGWIPCDGVHFPEENVYVRVTTWTETEKIGFRRDGKWFVYGSDGMAEATVLAWQPTQPYQLKGE